MPDYPPLSTRVIGETESALGALLAPLLAQAGLTFPQWVVLTLTAGNQGIAPDQLIAAVADARKLAAAEVALVLDELREVGALTATEDGVTLTPDGEARYAGVRGHVAEVTRTLFDFPAEDLVVAGRVLATLTARANAVLTAPR